MDGFDSTMDGFDSTSVWANTSMVSVAHTKVQVDSIHGYQEFEKL